MTRKEEIIWRGIKWVGGSFWRVLLVLCILSYMLSCSPSESKTKQRRKLQKRQVVYELPYTLESIAEAEIDRCFSDGKITHSFKNLATQWREYLDENFTAASYEQLVAQYKPYQKWMLTNKFRVINCKAQNHVQVIVDDIIARTPDLQGMYFKVHIVENRSDNKLEKPYLGACTTPGTIYYGKTLYDVAMQREHGGISSVAYVAFHEIAHSKVSFPMYSQEEAFTSSILPDGLAHFTDRIIDAVRLPLSDAEEIYADMYSVKLLADHPRYDPIDGLKILRVFREYEDQSSVDWLTTHPLSSHRYSCLLSQLIDSKTIKILN